MNETDRRDVLRNAGLAVTAAAIGDPLGTTQAQAQTAKAALKQAELPNDLTRKLAQPASRICRRWCATKPNGRFSIGSAAPGAGSHRRPCAYGS
jgi:hypothetical protein